jgi:hypothetical protein
MGNLARSEKRKRAATVRSEETEYEPRTPLGKRLWNLRQAIARSGEPLLDWNDIEKEVAERRGEKDR